MSETERQERNKSPGKVSVLTYANKTPGIPLLLRNIDRRK